MGLTHRFGGNALHMYYSITVHASMSQASQSLSIQHNATCSHLHVRYVSLTTFDISMAKWCPNSHFLPRSIDPSSLSDRPHHKDPSSCLPSNQPSYTQQPSFSFQHKVCDHCYPSKIEAPGYDRRRSKHPLQGCCQQPIACS